MNWIELAKTDANNPPDQLTVFGYLRLTLFSTGGSANNPILGVVVDPRPFLFCLFREGVKNIRVGGCTNFAPFGRRMLTLNNIGRSHLDPPKMQVLGVHPPPKSTSREKFLKENFVSPPKKSKIIANILYN